jgi:hypothetical protein
VEVSVKPKAVNASHHTRGGSEGLVPRTKMYLYLAMPKVTAYSLAAKYFLLQLHP